MLSCSLLFHCRSFSAWWPLAFLIFSPPLQNFHVVLPTKKCLLNTLDNTDTETISAFSFRLY